MQAVLDWRVVEARIALLVAVFGALLGSVVGVLWHAVAPQVGIVAAAEGSSAATKALIGDDLWFGLLGVLAGVLCVLVLLVVAPHASRGPGAQLGLAVGGVLGMLVAARVGHLIGHHDLAGVVRTGFPQGGDKLVSLVLSYFDFKVRATAMLFSWPLSALFLSVTVEWLRAVKEPTPLRVSPYPGSP